MKRILLSLILISAIGTLHQQAKAAPVSELPEGVHVGFFIHRSVRMASGSKHDPALLSGVRLT